MLKCSPRFIYKSTFKKINVQAFLHDVCNSNLREILFIPDLYLTFLEICDKHTPFHRFRVSEKNNPWFKKSVSNLVRPRNIAWSTAKKNKNSKHQY